MSKQENKEKEQTTKEFLKELDSGDYANLWELNDTLKSDHPDDKAPFLKIFNEDQVELLKVIVHQMVTALEFHNSKDSEAHSDIREVTMNTDAKLRNHRHDTTKSFSAKTGVLTLRNKITSIPFSLSQENLQRIIELMTDIRSDIQYSILILSNHPDAKVVQEVRAILATNNRQQSDCVEKSNKGES